MKIPAFTEPLEVEPRNLDDSVFYATHVKNISLGWFYLGSNGKQIMAEIVDWAADYDLSGFRFKFTDMIEIMSYQLRVYFASEHHATMFALQWSHLQGMNGLTI